VGYPSEQEEVTIAQRVTGPQLKARPIISTEELLDLQRQADGVYADPEIMAYAVRLAAATRRPAEFGLADIERYLSYGASPRASINLVLSARALAMLRGRDYVLPSDVRDLAVDVLRHRLVLSYEAFSDRVTPDALAHRVLEQVKLPARPMTSRFHRTGQVVPADVVRS